MSIQQNNHHGRQDQHAAPAGACPRVLAMLVSPSSGQTLSQNLVSGLHTAANLLLSLPQTENRITAVDSCSAIDPPTLLSRHCALLI
jgi:hypothetical protein